MDQTILLVLLLVFLLCMSSSIGLIYYLTPSEKTSPKSTSPSSGSASTPSESAETPMYTYTESSDQSGQTINMYPNKTRAECESLCDATNTCAGFVTKDSDKTCWIVKDFPNVVSAPGYAIAKRSSVVSKPSTNYTYTESSDQSGQSIQAYSWKTREECEALCDTTPGCAGIVTSSINDRGCWTVKGFPSVVSAENFATGVRASIV